MSAKRHDSFRGHFRQLKAYLKPALTVFLLLMASGYYLSDYLLNYIRELIGLKIISIHPYEIFLTKVQAGFYLAVILTMPIIVVQLVRFFRPALTEREYTVLKRLVPFFFVMSGLGILAGFIFLTEMATGFLSGLATGTGIVNTWTISNVTSYMLRLSLATAVIFNIPLIVVGLVRSGLVELEVLESYRRYVIVGSVIFAGLLSPPDFFSMMFLAVPSYAFYELGLKVSSTVQPAA